MGTGDVFEGEHAIGGTLYNTFAEYEAEAALRKAWADFYRDFNHWRPSPGVTLDAIKQARALLGMEKP